jgi:hypothetical protein
MYEALLLLHNLVRWLVLLFGLWALLDPRPRPGALFAHTLTLQVVLGVVLAFLSPLFQGALAALDQVIPFYAESLVLGHQWNRVCRLRVSGSWARTRHRSATTSIISSRSRKYRLATASFTKGHTRSTGCSSGL